MIIGKSTRGYIWVFGYSRRNNQMKSWLSRPRVRSRSCSVPFVGVMRRKRKSTKISFGRKTLTSIRLQIDIILEAQHRAEIEQLDLKPIARNDGNFVVAKYVCASDPENRRSRLFAVKRFGDFCDVWLAGPECGEYHNGDAA